jgi:uncharacterized iron-regulated protein
MFTLKYVKTYGHLMYKTLFSALVLLSFIACSTPQTGIKHKLNPKCDYYSLKTAQCQTTAQLVKAIEPYSVIFIGDHHDQDNLHQKVAELIRVLAQNGTKIHLANEWFYPEDEAILKKFSSNDINETEFQKKIQWKKRLRRNKYESFSPMYNAVRDTKGKLHGINISKKQRKKISDQNLSAMSKEELAFNKALDLNVYPHRELILPFLSHCHAPKKGESLKECSERMYRVQVAWDTKMAIESYKLFLNLKTDEKLLVFAGAMHIETGLGIPLRFSRLSNTPTISIVPVNLNTKYIDNDTSDFLLYYKKKDDSK